MRGLGVGVPVVLMCILLGSELHVSKPQALGTSVHVLRKLEEKASGSFQGGRG